MEGCIGTTHWEGCETCAYCDDEKGCTINTEIPLSVYLNDWIICDDYERMKELNK